MSAIRWTPALAIGHAEIDEQHRELFRRVAALLEAMTEGDGTAATRLFDYLGTYAADHFAAEEQLMRESSFPGLTVHKAAHDRFVRDYQALKELHHSSGANGAVTVKAKSWLVEWLQKHIGNTDVQLARYLVKKAG